MRIEMQIPDEERGKQDLLREIRELREKIKRLEEDKFRIIQR